MAFVWLLPAALHSGVLPSVLVLSTVALCFRCLRSCSMAPIVALISRLEDAAPRILTPKKSQGEGELLEESNRGGGENRENG